MAVDRQLSEFLRFLSVIKYRITSSLEKVKQSLCFFGFWQSYLVVIILLKIKS